VNRLYDVFADQLPSRLHVVLADSVFEYYYAGQDEEFSWSDFPNLAPPWPMFWIEGRFPPYWVADGMTQPRATLEKPLGDLSRVGVLFIASDARAASSWLPPTKPTGCDEGYWGALKSFIETAVANDWQWLLTAIAFTPALGPVISSTVGINADGTAGPVQLQTLLVSVDPPPDLALLGELQGDLIWPGVLALSFLHCRNCELRPVAPSRAERRQAAREGRPPRGVYHVLDVLPMRAVLQREAGKATSIRQALHICRGHFKRFDARPLFGKHRGVFWWPMHLRGDPNRGAIGKSYRLKLHAGGRSASCTGEER
jgi:hypothetical protein